MSFSRLLVPDNKLGELLLEVVFRLEERFPHTLGRIGRYAMIIVRK